MSFHNSAVLESIELVTNGGETPHILVAQVYNADGELCHSSIDLDEILGNEDGYFMWDGANFSHSAHGVGLDKERADGHIWIVGMLKTANGDYRELQGVALSEKIENQNGTLVYLG